MNIHDIYDYEHLKKYGYFISQYGHVLVDEKIWGKFMKDKENLNIVKSFKEDENSK